MRWTVSPKSRLSTSMAMRSVCSKLSRMYSETDGINGAGFSAEFIRAPCAVENEAAVIFITIGVVAVNFDDFGDKASAGAAFEVHDNIHGVAHVCFDRAIRQVHTTLQHATRESRKALFCGSGMDGGETS